HGAERLRFAAHGKGQSRHRPGNIRPAANGLKDMAGLVVRGRAVNVAARSDGTYAVLLIDGEDARQFGWFATPVPVRLGSLVEFEGAQLESFHQAQGRAASVTIIRGGKMRVVDEPWARRYVPAPWRIAVQRATRQPLYPHQIEGSAWVGERLSRGLGCLLADDQGLGKTVQVLAGLLVSGCFPALIVCPSSLKLNWQLEVAKHLRVD